MQPCEEDAGNKGLAAGHHLQASKAILKLAWSSLPVSQHPLNVMHVTVTGEQWQASIACFRDTHSLLAGTVMLEGQAQTDLSAQFEQLMPPG